MIRAAVDAAAFMQKIIIPVVRAPREKMFNRPNLSARIPGMIRPNVEAMFVIARR